jgi:hypothetical protein
MKTQSSLSPETRDLGSLGLDAYPLEGEIRRILAKPAPGGWRPSGLTREAFRWDAAMRLQADADEIANRNGVYRLLRLVAPSRPAHLEIH